MLDQIDIAQQQKLLEAHRRTLAHSLEQYNALGVLTPPALAHNIREAWASIAQIKTTLRAQGVHVTDDRLDEPRELTLLFRRLRQPSAATASGCFKRCATSGSWACWKTRCTARR